VAQTGSLIWSFGRTRGSPMGGVNGSVPGTTAGGARRAATTVHVGGSNGGEGIAPMASVRSWEGKTTTTAK
jgi:hypothetical protein